jgi:hypothetical protein
MSATAEALFAQPAPSNPDDDHVRLRPVVVLSERARRARDVAWMLEAFSGRDLRELASLCDLRDKRQRNQWLALWAGPPLCDPKVPLPPLLPEVLGAAMSYLAWKGWSAAGLLSAATEYNADRLGPWIIDRVVRKVLEKRDRGEL